jgi:aspartyl-tRNA(Asn)/glutamyl-tRNA(Gln) amidotransferase subunit B
MEQRAYEAVIGLEVHCQLRTASKAFSPEAAAFGALPNRQVDPVSLGHPGTLPVLNRAAVVAALRMGLATHCHIQLRSILARKHYFYPDLPKGYQISQYDRPLCFDGYLELDPDAGDPPGQPSRRIGLTRIHLEEDAGKSLHDQDPYATLLDFNRCGVPLIEIVSEPDLRSPREAGAYLQHIRQLVRWLDICDGNMEEGSLRCDANVSVRLQGETRLGTKAEIKNMNSVRNVERALEYEIQRQVGLHAQGQPIVQETRLWDASRQETRPMRSKEEAHDYRYFPDPDLVPLVVDAAWLETVRSALPELPQARRRRFIDAFGLPAYDATLLTEERALSDYFEQTLSALAGLGVAADRVAQAKLVSNLVMTAVLRVLNEGAARIEAFPIAPERLVGLLNLRLADQISATAMQELFDAMLEDPRPAGEIARTRNLLQISDVGALLPVVEQVLAAHPKEVTAWLAGKEALLGFFVGQVMRNFPGAPDPRQVRTLLTEALARRRGA